MNLILVAGAGVGKEFYKNVSNKLKKKFDNIKIIVPIGDSFKYISDMVYNELTKEDKDFVLMGHCFGGLVSMNVISNYKAINRLKGLILVNSYYNFTFINDDVISNSGEQFSSYKDYAVTSVINGLIPKDTLHKQFDIAFKIDLNSSLNNIKIPTLIVSSDKDGFFSKNKEIEMHSKIRNSRLKIIKNARHLGLLTHVNKYVNQIYLWEHNNLMC